MDVSIVIPCRDAEAYLAQTIGSVLEQSHPPNEVIVVDDGSADTSLEIARRFEARFPDRVHVYTHPAGGAPAARNLGAAAATGDALMFLDADDVVAPDTLGSLVAALEREPEGVAICPWYRMVEEDGRFVQRPPSSAPRRPGDDALSAWLASWYHPPCAVLWSRHAFERAGRWDELSASNQDGDLMMRALALETPLVHAPTGAGYYRLAPAGHSSLASSRFTRRGILSRLRTVRKIAAWLEERGRLTGYLAPLHESFRLIARDLCADEPDLRATALAEARRFRPGATTRLRRYTAGLGFRAARRAKRRARRVARGVLRRPTEQTAGGPEVTFGLGLAAKIASAGAPAPSSAASVTRPVVSVVLPTYDRARLLTRAIDSALSQTMSDLEVLVIDDASTDATSETVAAYDDERLRYLVQPENRGVSAARNRGLREARGEFIAFLDSDDEWLPDKLAFQVTRLRSLPDEVGLLYGGVTNHEGREHRDTHVPSHRGAIYRDLLVFNPIHGTSSVLIRRSVVATAGFFDESLPAIEDYDYWLRVSRFFDVDYVDRPVSRYHDEDVADRRSLDIAANLEARRRFYRKHESEMRHLGVAHEFLLLSVRRHLANDDVPGARRLAAQAIRRSPSSIEAYRRLAGTLLPWSAKRVLADVAG